jgi:hypothetical protein
VTLTRVNAPPFGYDPGTVLASQRAIARGALALAGAKGSPDHPFDDKDIWPTLAANKASPHEDVLINAEAFRGAIRKGNWKVVKIALLPGKTELFDLS